MTTTALKQIGRRIAESREDRTLTQAQLGELIGTTQSAIARIEKGEQNVSAEMLGKISRALKKDILNLSQGGMNLAIEGGHKLSGTIRVNGSKNGAVALLCASLLNKNVTVLKNMPRIEEVFRIIEALESIGVSVTWSGSSVEIRPPANLSLENLDIEAARKTRSVVMFIGPLVHVLNSFRLPHATGCRLGSRTVRPHFFALEKLGVSIDTDTHDWHISHDGLAPAEIVMYESGDTATENALMAAARIPGTTTIKYASANYMVQDLCYFLEVLGVKIEGVGTTTLTVHGKEVIDQPVEYSVSEDPTDAMFFLTAAILTDSTIVIERAPIAFLELELLVIEKMGFKYDILKRYKSENGMTDIVDIKAHPSKLTAPEDKVHARPYPGLNMDNLPFFAVIATQAEGTTLIHDWTYEKRALYFTELDRLGAETVLADPHRIFITGPTRLRAAEMVCPPALRPATIILIAMLAAEGRSILRNIYSINRGYEDLADKLNSLGAKVSVHQDLA
jgi:UDP-N-acetylglucosamine 1-carboxyvinyltransferase